MLLILCDFGLSELSSVVFLPRRDDIMQHSWSCMILQVATVELTRTKLAHQSRAADARGIS